MSAENDQKKLTFGRGFLQRIQMGSVRPMTNEELQQALDYVEEAVNAPGISLEEQKQFRDVLREHGRESRGSATGIVQRGLAFIRHTRSQDGKISTHRKPEDDG